MRLIALLLCVGLVAESSAREVSIPAQGTTWMAVLMSGRKIGSIRMERSFDDSAVKTTQTISIELLRAGRPLHIRSTTRTVETFDGEPLAFFSTSALSAIDNTVESRRLGARQFEVTTDVGGQRTTRRLTVPDDALVFDGQRKTMAAHAAQVGSSYRLRQFDPASQSVLDIDMLVLGNEKVALPNGIRTLSHQRQRLRLGSGDQVVDLWLDQDGTVLKGRMKLLGQQMDMLACDRACAEAPAQSVDLFRSAMVASPRPLTANLRSEPLTYRIRLLGGGMDQLIETDEQRIRPISENEFFLDVHRATPGTQAGPSSLDTAPTPWVQSDAPAIRAMAGAVVGKTRNPRNKMRRLRSHVSDYVTEHGLDVGYASALEVLGSRKGDCTEYAVLLAALARAQGIPARVVTGMVYADRYAGTLRVFVPHAWVQAWVGDHWESYDAALRRFDATHIALTVGDGNPARYFGATQLFGHLQIERVTPSDELAIPSPPPPAPPPPIGAGSGRG